MIHKIAVTGAQGTGKSGFARSLCEALGQAGLSPTLHAGLGSKVKERHSNVGNLASAQVVRAFWRAHQHRWHSIRSGLNIYDRCYADLMAYARVLGVLRPSELSLLESSTRTEMRDFTAVYVLPYTGPYMREEPGSEPEDFRQAIDREIVGILRELEISFLHVSKDAAGLAFAARDIEMKTSRARLDQVQRFLEASP